MSNAKFLPAVKTQGNAVRRETLPGDPLGKWGRASLVNPPLSQEHGAGLSQLRLNRVMAFVESHLAADLCVSTLAAVAGMSSYYFCRSFKQSTGITPHRYVLGRRMEQAKLLLEKNGASLLEIAQQVGFTDQSQFTRVFHKMVGITPSQFRKTSS